MRYDHIVRDRRKSENAWKIVISASRRTDIPAFYSEWFIGRVREGYVRWHNPFGGQVHKTSLAPADVGAIVFWSKNFRPLLSNLDELDALGYGLIFHFTITGLPRAFEPNVPPAEETIPIAHILARRYAPEAVLWRYDPILISNLTDPDYHLRRFSMLAAALEGATRRCYISFPTLYDKVRRNLERLRSEHGIESLELEAEDRRGLADELARIAHMHGMAMYACCCEDIVSKGLLRASCVDAELLARLYPDRVGPLPLRPSRKGCGCYQSVDIGAYNTCPHGCVYCYANASKSTALRRYREHDPESDFLIRTSGCQLSRLQR